jgi:hypothetical protein
VSNPLGFVSQDRSLVWAKSTPTFQIRFWQRSNSADATSFINTSPFDQSALLQDSEYVYEDFHFNQFNIGRIKSMFKHRPLSKKQL